MAGVTADPEVLQLLQQDKVVAALIQQFGPYQWHLNTPFETLVRAVVGQVISATVAKTVYQRLLSQFGHNQLLDVTALKQTDTENLRTLGLSQQKANTIKHLADWTLMNDINCLGQSDNQTIVKSLTTIRGIGEWTAQMFLMFSLGRLNVWPIADLGVINAARQLHATDGRRALRKLGEQFAPYQSVVTWYYWQHVVQTSRPVNQ